jgi:hypothetical protein
MATSALLQQAKALLLSWRPVYGEELVVPEEPEPVYLLGNRWADYGLALFWALAFPIVRGALRSAIFEVRGRCSSGSASPCIGAAFDCTMPMRTCK